ncbi:NAD(P)/FAD-dependent oxidoreductase [Undibacterium squillarum]|uniref:Membrane protein n=1 Tax=Undibacterium squillarum TaxID=1131567 RepID=A0ABQ2XUA2_9BURK|nr:NAD(P)/FAD-dependent oxidoreductase [Undibacterium squillarum]GGX33001.1 membrane protein [Undibacterium squillarum]
MEVFDVVVIGAGAAGMMCAATAAGRGRRVALLDHATKLAEKIRISGGGRCNFTNLHAGPSNYLSNNPHFCRSALSRYTPQDFLALLKKYHVAWHEKHKGQLFCDDSAEQIIRVLKAECDKNGVCWRMPAEVDALESAETGFVLQTSGGKISAQSVVLATGGLSIPKIGATDFAYRIARQFVLRMVEPRPALVPLTFAQSVWAPFVPLAGISLEVDISTGTKKNKITFREDLLFTHRGLSGPAILQISSYWEPGTPLTINLLPETDLADELLAQKSGNKKQLLTVLTQYMPARLAEVLLITCEADGSCRMADLSDKVLRRIGEAVNQWQLIPDGTEGYRKAEVTRGGIDTRELSQQTMMVQKVPGLYVVGEAMDVTGWLGGYNFQWAWASGYVAGLSA